MDRTSSHSQQPIDRLSKEKLLAFFRSEGLSVGSLTTQGNRQQLSLVVCMGLGFWGH